MGYTTTFAGHIEISKVSTARGVVKYEDPKAV